MTERVDARIDGVDVITVGTKKIAAIDWSEVDDQAFTLTSATVTLYEADGNVPSTDFTDVTASIEAGIGGVPRVQVVFDAVETAVLTPGPHYFIWKITLGDSTTRIVKGHVRVRSVT